MNEPVETRALMHLLAVAQTLHFGKASRELGISQPALSKSIQRLEQSLGGALLDRSRKKAALTPLGELVVERARRVVAETERLQRDATRVLHAELGALRVGIGPAMAETYVAEAIGRLAETHPGIHLQVRLDHWKQLSDWLFEGRLDLYVADVTAIKDDSRVEICQLPPEPLVWFCRRQHPLGKASVVERRDLLSYPLVTPRMPPWAVAWFAEQAPAPASGRRETYATVECESYAMLKRIVLGSDCISAALHSTIADELRSGVLIALPVQAPGIQTNAGIVRLRERTSLPIADLFVRAVEEAARRASLD